MEQSLEHYYNNFITPPPAPVYRPSEEEFIVILTLNLISFRIQSLMLLKLEQKQKIMEL